MATIPAGVLVRFTEATQVGGHEMDVYENGSVKLQNHRQSDNRTKEISQEKITEIKVDVSKILTLKENRYTIWVNEILQSSNQADPNLLLPILYHYNI